MKILAWLLPLALLAQAPTGVTNDYTRTIVATSRPGPKGGIHQHDVNRVMIYLDAGRQHLEFQDGTVKDFTFTPGQVMWDPKGALHTSQNLGPATYRVIEIELKKDGAAVQWPALDVLKVGPKNYSVELENDQVRVIRAKLGPREKMGEHEHKLPRLLIPLTELQIESTNADGSKGNLTGKPGDVIFAQPGRHREENMKEQPSELLIVEFKS